MIPVLFPSTATSFTTYGLGALSDAISAEVEEERNGGYELTMQYPLTGIHYDEIGLRSIILAKPNFLDNPQPFRVYQITKPINGVVTFYARHLSYDLSDIPVQPFEAAGIQSAMNGLLSNAMGDVSNWTLTTSRTTASSFKVDEPSSIRSWFGGKEGSLLDIYGGEWHYNGYTCSLENSRGSDKGIVIRYGVNLTDLKQDENCTSIYTGVLAFWKDMDGNLVQGSIQNVPGTFNFTRIYILDCSEDYDEAPTAAQLNAKALAYIDNHDVGVPKINLKLNFATFRGNSITGLFSNEDGEIVANEMGFMLLAYGYQGMPETRVDLCDTVSVYFEKLGVRAKAKCIRVRWNVLLDRYEEVELGDNKSELTEAIIKANTEASEAVKLARLTQNVLDSEIQTAVEKITGNLGGYIVLHDSNDDGYPDELLIMNTNDITTATNVWRWNQNGLMHANSYTGTYANAAITMDGRISADAITTGTLRGIEIISDDSAGNTIDLVNGAITTTSATLNAKTVTKNYSYQILDANNTQMASFSISYSIDQQGNMYPNGGSLMINNSSGEQKALLTKDTFYLRAPSSFDPVVSIRSDGSGGSLFLYESDGTLATSISSYNGGALALMNHGTMGLSLSGVGHNIIGYATNGTWIYQLGELSITGLMQNVPSLIFYDTSGARSSFYSGDRAYIKDTTSGSEGYVVHGQTGAHGITVDFTIAGYIDFYVDNTFVGYAPLSSSDKKTKKGIKSISQKYKDAVASVDLKSFHFNFKNEVLSGANGLLRFGAVAQDVISALEAQGIDPEESELVGKAGKGKEERYVINYVPFLVARLAADEDRIKKLEEQNKALEDRLAALEARLED